MAFTLNTFQFNRGINTSNANGNGIGSVIHAYKTSDLNADAIAPGYFPDYIDGATDKVFVGDLLLIVSSDSTYMARIEALAPFTLGADLFSNAGAPLVMGAPIAAVDGNAGKITGTTLQLEYADGTQPGILSIGSQTIAGIKSFSNLINANGGLRFFGNTSTLSFYDTTTFSTTFDIGSETTASTTFYLTRIGNLVSISHAATVIGAPQGSPGPKFTSNSLVPADYRPTTSGDFSGVAVVLNNSVFKAGVATIDSSGALVIYNDYNQTTDFTSSVSNGFQAVSIIFSRG